MRRNKSLSDAPGRDNGRWTRLSAGDAKERLGPGRDLPLRLEHRSDARDGRALHLELAGELPVWALRVAAKGRLHSRADFAARHMQGQCGHGIDLFESTGTHASEPLAARSSRAVLATGLLGTVKIV